ncbi:unnamed protein product [Strongylus vulgaris]|uniref:Uncharacterized protein n=1 Tax=Strongylus vulgaris TaxID=40348 RepID=A0A3P7JIR4_STRVU|nr:unnamed protein product [Strongylus vulgaris]
MLYHLRLEDVVDVRCLCANRDQFALHLRCRCARRLRHVPHCKLWLRYLKEKRKLCAYFAI